MKAIVYERYGPPDVLELRDLPRPEPKANEILARVRATSVSVADSRLRALRIPWPWPLVVRLVFGWNGPRKQMLGFELAGEVEAVGAAVTKFRVGDRVFAARKNSYCEYVCIAEDAAIAPIPGAMSFEQAACICFGGATTLTFFDLAGLRAGEHVLVNGASGACGTAAVQIAKQIGCEVTGVCSTANVELVRSLGADHVVDYTQEDFTKNGRSYDVIVDCVGNATFARAHGSLTGAGRLLMVYGTLRDQLRGLVLPLFSRRRIVGGMARMTPERIQRLVELCASGAYRPVVDRVYPIEQIREAHAYVDLGHKKGNVAVTL